MSAAAVVVSFVATYTAQMVIEKTFDSSGEETTLRKKIRAVFNRIIPDIIQPLLYAIFWQNVPYAVLLTHIEINLRVLPYLAMRTGRESGWTLLWERSTNEVEIFVVCVVVVLLFRAFSAQCCKFLRQQVCPAYEQSLRRLEKILVVRFQIGDAHFWIYYFGAPYVCSFTNQGMPLPSPSDNPLEFARHLMQKTPPPHFPPEIPLSQTYSDWKERAERQGIYGAYKAWLRKCAGMSPNSVEDTPGTRDAATEDTPATTLSAPESGNSAQFCRPPKKCETLKGLLCSLTEDLITYPVKDHCGRNYERREIVKWLEKKEEKYPPERLAEMDPEDRKAALLEFCPQKTNPITRNTLQYDFFYHFTLAQALESLAAQRIRPEFKEGLLSYVEGVFADQQSRSDKRLEEMKKLYVSEGMDEASFLKVKKNSEEQHYLPRLSLLKERFKPAVLVDEETH